MAENPVTFKVDKPGIQADRLICLVKLLDFLSALASNNQFIIKLVKMWPGGTPHVAEDKLRSTYKTKKKKKKKKEFSRVL